MRKNVLFIAKFDNILKGMNTLLAKSFNMQMCPPEPAMVEKTLHVMEIDLVLFYISGLSERLLSHLSGKLDQVCLQTPIVIFGTADECAAFDARCAIAVSKYMHRPLAAQDIIKAISELFEAPPETVPQLPDDAPAPAPAPPRPEIGQHMSLADLADALDTETDGRRCVLLVDDDGRILRAMKMLLEKDYRVNLANSAISALESIERERPDVVLLDYEMPVFDGKQTLEMIRKNPKTHNLPVFFLTGVADKERIRDVIHLMPQGYLLKSSEQHVILDALEKFFSDPGR